MVGSDGRIGQVESMVVIQSLPKQDELAGEVVRMFGEVMKIVCLVMAGVFLILGIITLTEALLVLGIITLYDIRDRLRYRR